MQFELAPFALPADYGDGIVPLAAMKEHLGVTFDDHDDLIGAFRDAAVDMVERYCGMRLGEDVGGEWRAEELPRQISLGIWPVLGVTAIEWLGPTGEQVIGDPTIWRVVRRDVITLKPGASLPSNVAGGVRISFDSGFDHQAIPAALVQAVKLFAAHLYKHREAVSSGTMSGEVPFGFRHLCGLYRVPVI